MTITRQRHTTKLLAALIPAVVLGCASVRNLDSAGNRIGFAHYSPRFYLVITPTKDKGEQVSLLTLPDLTKDPSYIRHKAGWGSVEFGFKLANGVLTEFSAKGDSKAPETLTAIAGLGTAYAGYLTAKVTAAAGAGAAPGTRVEVTIDTLVDLENKLAGVVADIDTHLNSLTPGDNTLAAINRDLGSERVKLGNAAYLPGQDLMKELAAAQKTAGEVAKVLEALKVRLTAHAARESTPGDTAGVIDKAVQDLDPIITEIKRFAASSATGTRIFELVVEKGVLTFRPVDL